MTRTPPGALAMLLNVQPGEGRRVGLLILLYFCLSLAIVVTQTVAFALFLAEYGPQNLPYVYLVTAAGAAAVAFLYLKLVERLPFPTLLLVNVTFLLIAGLAVRLGLALPGAGWVIFALPVWFQVLVNLGNLAFWALAASLFDVRQGKRLFGLVSAGNWGASVVGGFVVAPLVAWLGTANLLLLAAGSLAVALAVLRVIVRSYLSAPAQQAAANPKAIRSMPAASLLRSRYVLLIFAFIFLWWLGYFVVDNIFLDRVYAQFTDADQVASFLGNFFAIIGLIALITTTFVTGPLVNRYGLWAGLLIVPGLLFVCIAALALLGTFGGAALILFWLAATAKLVDVALGFALDQPAHSVLYKPLPVSQIGRVATAGEGIVQPLAIGAAGLSLLLFNVRLSFDAVGLSYVFLVVGAAWIGVTVVLIRAYPQALAQALAKRQLGDAYSPHELIDHSSLSTLRQNLRNPHPGAALYAMNLLEQFDPPSLTAALPALLDHPAPEVRREAFGRIERLELTQAATAIRERLSSEPVPLVREAALRALAAADPSASFAELSEALDDPDLHTQRGALIGLLRHGGIDGVLAAGQTLNRLVKALAPADRVLAAQVLGEAGVTHFYRPALTLLHDADPEVRRAALGAAGRIKHPRLWPAVVEACASPETARAAALALAAGGEAALPEIEAALARIADQPRERLIALTRACGRIRGPRVVRLLQDKIDFRAAEVRTHILSALSACGYQAIDPAPIRAQLHAEVAQAAWITAALIELGDDVRTALLNAALTGALKQIRDRLFLLLSFIYDGPSMLRGREALYSDMAAQRAYALEVVDAQLPANLRDLVLPVLEDGSPAQRLAKLSADFPQAGQSRTSRLQALIAGPEAAWFTPWTRACALYTAGRLADPDCTNASVAATSAAERLVRETAHWALARLNTSSLKGDGAMLSTIEKVIILKSVSVFDQTPDDVLADVAALLEEVDAAEGETIFHKNDLGDSLYVIASGKVRVHDGQRLLSYLGEREVFGEMALLDPEPRLASVTAAEPTQLFRLARAPFYELLNDRPEVGVGIIRVLTSHLRARVRDLAQLDARVKELEAARSGA